MKQMRTDLTPTRVARCKALLRSNPMGAADRLRTIAYGHPDRFLEMLTDEAVETLAFEQMTDRVISNKLRARNRALFAARQRETAP